MTRIEKFIVGMGAPTITEMILRIDLDKLSYQLRATASAETSQQRRKNKARLQVVESFRASNGFSRPEWMILKVVPVIPPDLRPLWYR